MKVNTTTRKNRSTSCHICHTATKNKSRGFIDCSNCNNILCELCFEEVKMPKLNPWYKKPRLDGDQQERDVSFLEAGCSRSWQCPECTEMCFCMGCRSRRRKPDSPNHETKKEHNSVTEDDKHNSNLNINDEEKSENSSQDIHNDSDTTTVNNTIKESNTPEKKVPKRIKLVVSTRRRDRNGKRKRLTASFFITNPSNQINPTNPTSPTNNSDPSSSSTLPDSSSSYSHPSPDSSVSSPPITGDNEVIKDSDNEQESREKDREKTKKELQKRDKRCRELERRTELLLGMMKEERLSIKRQLALLNS